MRKREEKADKPEQESGDGGREGRAGRENGLGRVKECCRKYWKKIFSAVFWLLLWQLAACLVGSRLLLAGPLETLQALGQQIFRGSFWLTVGASLLRIGAGFTAGFLLGLLLAAAAGRFTMLEELLSPVMALLKAIPVASFVVLFLIWWRSGVLATAVSFCIVLPMIYVNTLEGIRRVDRRLLEMADVLGIPAWNRFFYIYRPALRPYLDNGIRISVGMSWKSGVAAEVIGIPALSVGEQLYLSKVYLDTAGVLAWTAVTILASVLCQWLVLALANRLQQWEPVCRAPRRAAYGYAGAGTGSPGRYAGQGKPAREVLTLEHVSRHYRGRPVVEDVTASYERGRIYYFRTPSGSGKTTLFRLIAGLEQPDAAGSGTGADGFAAANVRIDRHDSRIAMLFQEDRLCEEYSALINVDMVTGNRERSREYLRELLAEEDLDRPCREFSGGMKRRVAIARTMAAGGDVILLDEPYAGLDAENRCRVREYIREYGKDSAMLVATHAGSQLL